MNRHHHRLLRSLHLLHWLLRALVVQIALAACSEPSRLPPTDAGRSEVLSVEALPAIVDGRVAAATRFAIGGVGATSSWGDLRAALVLGDLEEVEADGWFASRSAAKEAREVKTHRWSDGSSLLLQPIEAMPAGPLTLLLVYGRQKQQLRLVVDEARPMWQRLWPAPDEPLAPGQAATYCTSERPPVASLELGLVGASIARMQLRSDSPCFDVCFEPPLPMGLHALVPWLADVRWSLDPAPLRVGGVGRVGRVGRVGDVALVPEVPCPLQTLALGPLCLGLQDDRAVFATPTGKQLILGALGSVPLAVRLEAGSRFVLRGLTPASTVHLAVSVRDDVQEQRVEADLRTTSERSHLVVNEALARPPSALPSQRFVELFNDGPRRASLEGFVLLDGKQRIALPSAEVPAYGFVLLTPEGFVAGLGGDVPPAPGALRITTDRLTLAGDLQLVAADGRTESHFPMPSSTRTASRVRRTPEAADDADSFAWDADGRASPGAPNDRTQASSH